MTTPAPTTTAAVIGHLTATGDVAVGVAIAAAAVAAWLLGYSLWRAARGRRP